MKVLCSCDYELEQCGNGGSEKAQIRLKSTKALKAAGITREQADSLEPDILEYAMKKKGLSQDLIDVEMERKGQNTGTPKSRSATQDKQPSSAPPKATAPESAPSPQPKPTPPQASPTPPQPKPKRETKWQKESRLRDEVRALKEQYAADATPAGKARTTRELYSFQGLNHYLKNGSDIEVLEQGRKMGVPEKTLAIALLRR